MNLLWHRNQQAIKIVNTQLNNDASTKLLHWAEVILERLKSPDAFAADLRKIFPNEMFPEAFEILDILHVPGRSLKILAQFKENQIEPHVSIVHVNFYPEMDYVAEYKKALSRAINPDKLGLLSDWHAIVRIFPEDADLPGLSQMLDLTLMASYLGETGTLTNEASWKMLSYQQGKRCALLYQFHRDGIRYFGKIQNGSKAGDTHQQLCLLWDNPARRFQIPRPVANDPSLGARWETFVSGCSLEEALQNSELEPLVRLVTSNLVSLHDMNIQELQAVTPEMILRRIESKILRRMHSLIPDLAGRADKIMSDLSEHLHWTENIEKVTLHGDFHIANFLLNEDGLVFIDMDNLCMGDPCHDLALFASRLMLRNLHHADRLPETLRIVSILPEIYTKMSGRHIRPDTFAWFLSALLIGRQIKSCMRVDAPDMDKLISKLLDWAEDSLEHGRFRGEIVE
jgi:thiamine kinase-like enzyme